MATLDQFRRRMRILGRRVEKNVPVLARRVALAVDQAVVLATPVDEGVARSNWQVGVGTPARGTRDAYVPGNAGSTGPANAAAAIGAAQGRLSTVRREVDIYISNNLPYIGRLNDGYSAQAPANFVQTAAQEGSRVVGRTRLLPRDLS